MSDNYYNTIAESYENLYKKEQDTKLNLLKHLIPKYYHITPNSKILDAGCGSGFSSDFDCYVVGIDNSEQLISRAKQKYNANDKISFILSDLNKKLAFKDKEFDITISLSAIHHATHLSRLLSELKRVTKSFIFISFPNRITRYNDIETTLMTAIQKNKLGLIAKIEHDVDNFFVIRI